MIPKSFDYHAPAPLEEAIRILGEDEEAKVLAGGGRSLLPMMKLRLAAPTTLVDISKLPGLSYVREEGGHLAIGALTIHDAVFRAFGAADAKARPPPSRSPIQEPAPDGYTAGSRSLTP